MSNPPLKFKILIPKKVEKQVERKEKPKKVIRVTNEMFSILKERVYCMKNKKDIFGFYQVLYYLPNQVAAREVKMSTSYCAVQTGFSSCLFCIDENWLAQHPYSKIYGDEKDDSIILCDVWQSEAGLQLRYENYIGTFYQLVQDTLDNKKPCLSFQHEFASMQNKIYAVADGRKPVGQRFFNFYQPIAYKEGGYIQARILKTNQLRNKNGTFSYRISKKWLDKHPTGFIMDDDIPFSIEDFTVTRSGVNGTTCIFKKNSNGEINGTEVPADYVFQ